MERHHKSKNASPLNLVSLMDIFTILVFFLLVNSSNTQQLPSNKDLTLPVSTAKKAPKETLIIVVTRDAILVQGRKVADITEASVGDEPLIAGLKAELEFLSTTPTADGEGRRVTIMGDENTTYALIRKIMATCQQLNFTKIAFAATQIAEKPDA
ncbi:MAG: biopolymer transporter ExbD [Alteromonadaceae bacterium]|nr:MAG: biopolymer transporter ExbD [Alteromonadaceae bacterium]